MTKMKIPGRSKERISDGPRSQHGVGQTQYVLFGRGTIGMRRAPRECVNFLFAPWKGKKVVQRRGKSKPDEKKRKGERNKHTEEEEREEC